jgi:hypothetical protein
MYLPLSNDRYGSTMLSPRTLKRAALKSANFPSGFFLRSRKLSLLFALSGAIALHGLKPNNCSHTPLLKVCTLEWGGGGLHRSSKSHQV